MCHFQLQRGSVYRHVSSPGLIPEASPLGLKGAAFAALGERPSDFGEPLTEREESEEGVKLGESTLRRFLLLQCHEGQ